MEHKHVPYRSFAEVYDRIMADVPYDVWADYIEAVWRRFSFQPVKILDLACGTGNFTLELASRGYRMTGVDLSQAMLDVALRKAQRMNMDIKFFQSDLRNLELGDVFHGATCVFDSLNYLLEPSHLKAAFRSVAQHLTSGGLFVFDVNTPQRLAAIPYDIDIFDEEDYYVVWKDSYHRGKAMWQVNLTGFLKEGERWERFDEIHQERAFPIDDIKKWLTESGFVVLGVYDSCSFIPASQLTSRAYFVSRKL